MKSFLLPIVLALNSCATRPPSEELTMTQLRAYCAVSAFNVANGVPLDSVRRHAPTLQLTPQDSGRLQCVGRVPATYSGR